MTRIRYTVNKKGCRMTFSGHAGAGNAGEDIVCAAVSMASGSLWINLEDAASKGKLAGVAVREDEKAAYRSICCHQPRGTGRAMYEFTARALRELAEQYPEYVHYEEERGCQES